MSDNNSNNNSLSSDTCNSKKIKIRKNKKQFYAEQRELIIQQLIELAHFDENNTILLIELQNNELLKKKLESLVDNIKKYYKCSTWGYFVSINNNKQGDLITLFKAIFRDHNYTIFSKNVICEYNNIKKRYVKLHFLHE